MLYGLLCFSSLLFTLHGTPEYDTTKYFVIDECINRGPGEGSQMCHCTEASEENNWMGSVHCYDYYDQQNCDGDFTESFWGGCDHNSGEYHVVTGCESAQQAATSGMCKHWVDTNGRIYPIDSCFYALGTFNSDNICDVGNSESASCRFSCENSDTLLYYYTETDDLTCSGAHNGSPQNITNDDYNCGTGSGNCQMWYSTCGTSAVQEDCSVRVDTYSMPSNGEFCQSSQTPWKTSSPELGCNYWKRSNNEIIAFDVCSTERFGYYEFQRKYMCDSNGDVIEYHYMDNECSDNQEIGTGVQVSWYNGTEEEGIVCSNTDSCGGGVIQYYRAGCTEATRQKNVWSTWYERAQSFGVCLPVYNKDTMELPWYNNLYYQITTYNKTRRMYHYYHSTDCSERQWSSQLIDFYYAPPTYGLNIENKYYYRCAWKLKGFKNSPGNSIKGNFYQCGSAFHNKFTFITSLIIIFAYFIMY